MVSGSGGAVVLPLAGHSRDGSSRTLRKGIMIMSSLRVLLVDSHTLFREGLALILGAEPDIEVVGMVGDEPAALAMLADLRPDLVLLDSEDGGAARRIKGALPGTVVVVLTDRGDQEQVVAALLAGADGYLLKSLCARDLIGCLRGARRGEPLPLSLGSQTLDSYRRMARGAAPSGRLAALTLREQEIVRLVGRGASNKEIARALQLSVNTVKTHIRHILEKLQIERRRDAYTYARYLEMRVEA